MYKFLLSVAFIALLTTCSKRLCGCEPAPPPNFLKATVLEVNESSCNKPLLLFEDSVAVAHFTGANSRRYVVNQLPDSLKIPGKKIMTIVELISPAEDFSCTSQTYPHLKVTFATGSY